MSWPPAVPRLVGGLACEQTQRTDQSGAVRNGMKTKGKRTIPRHEGENEKPNRLGKGERRRAKFTRWSYIGWILCGSVAFTCRHGGGRANKGGHSAVQSGLDLPAFMIT